MEFQTVRVHNAVTASAEKRLLVWMAQRMPAWVNSDHLTFLGAVALFGVGASFWMGGYDGADHEARTEMMYAATLAGIAFNASGCHLPHGLSYAVSGLARDWQDESAATASVP